MTPTNSERPRRDEPASGPEAAFEHTMQGRSSAAAYVRRADLLKVASEDEFHVTLVKSAPFGRLSNRHPEERRTKLLNRVAFN